MRVLSKKTLKTYWTIHQDCEQQLKTWYKESEEANWKNPNDIKRYYPSTNFLEDCSVVFNIKGNKYRIMVSVNYDFGIVCIRFVGTHAAYEKINASKI